MNLKELQYFYDESATKNNNIPIVNFNLSSSSLTLPSVPDLQLNNSFLTPMMHSVDHILSNWENEHFFMRGASVLEMLVHNLHMYETQSVAGQIYKKIKKSPKMRKGIKKLCNCIEVNDPKVLLSLEKMARNFREEKSVISWRKYYSGKGRSSNNNGKCLNYVNTFSPRLALP